MHDNDHPTVMLGKGVLALIQIESLVGANFSLPLLLILIIALKDENIIIN